MFINWASDPLVTRHLSWQTHADVSVTRSVLESWVAHYDDEDYYHWGVTLTQPSTLIGTVSVVTTVEEAELVHIGYCYGRRWWGRGLAAEALSALTGFFIGEVGARKVESMHDPRNPASGRVMEKCGMRQEGIRRQCHRSSLGICDGCYHGILAEEWAATRRRL